MTSKNGAAQRMQSPHKTPAIIEISAKMNNVRIRLSYETTDASGLDLSGSVAIEEVDSLEALVKVAQAAAICLGYTHEQSARITLNGFSPEDEF